ncbi:related to Na(+)/H(+) antiporter [Saccharomycodes ludwigii]|uniref:Related to Na(+)/H(+) antiporter n=1 Tax=Saccharomycodes ludwigii TaxID=36035 RepID=A0A376B2W3_9ASCO|nr:related to Na(+)/H(+) antiporter [Saccharomycodes ludwigii]
MFSVFSLFVKEKLYIGESTVAGIFGLIVGPHCLHWFNPTSWGNSDSITLEISRIILCLQIFAVAVELPKKYMLKHWLSVTMLLVPVMTAGWLIVGVFVFILIPGFSFSDGLLVSACITATDPILAQSVVSGKFAQKVPGHLRNLLSAESGCNDGMAFPFIYLSLNLIIHHGHDRVREIVKDWICVTILYECIFGCFLGVVIGYGGRHLIKFAEEKKLIDRESFLAFYVCLAFLCAGFGSILGVDDLLVSFSAGAAFAWDGWFSKKTKDSQISTVIDLLLNLAYFVYFGAIIPWEQFNNGHLGLNVWRLIVLAIVVIFLRRIPAVIAFRPLIPDIKTWREALFVGHFGPIGVGAIFASILARAELEHASTGEKTPLKSLPLEGTKYYQLIATIWPIVTFFILTSIIVHGSSVAIIVLGRHLNTIALTKTFTTHTSNGGRGPSWMSRLPALDKEGRSFSLQRVDTMAPPLSSTSTEDEKISFENSNSAQSLNYHRQNNGLPDVISRNSTIETSGIPARPIGGAKRKKVGSRINKIRKKRKELFSLDNGYSELNKIEQERIKREKEAQADAFALTPRVRPIEEDERDYLESHPKQQQQYQGEEETEDKDSERSNSDGILDSYDKDRQIEKTVTMMDQDNTSNVIAHLDTLATNVQGSPDKMYIKNELDSTAHGDLEKGPISVNYGNGTSSSTTNEEEEEEGTDSEEATNREDAKDRDNHDQIAYAEGNKVIIENRHGEIIDEASLDTQRPEKDVARRKLSNRTQTEVGNSEKEESDGRSIISDTASRISTVPSNSSYLRRVLTPTKSNPLDKKYFAYKIDNHLIIEDGNGDVLRRYKINVHSSNKNKSGESIVEDGSTKKKANTNRERSGSVFNKALSAVGLGKITSNTSKISPQSSPPTGKNVFSTNTSNNNTKPSLSINTKVANGVKSSELNSAISTKTNNRGSTPVSMVNTKRFAEDKRKLTPLPSHQDDTYSEDQSDGTQYSEDQDTGTEDDSNYYYYSDDDQSEVNGFRKLGDSPRPKNSNGHNRDLADSDRKTNTNNKQGKSLGEYGTESSDTEGEDERDETQFEKSRRLAALGAMPQPRQDDDEEEIFSPVITHPSKAHKFHL